MSFKTGKTEERLPGSGKEKQVHLPHPQVLGYESVEEKNPLIMTAFEKQCPQGRPSLLWALFSTLASHLINRIDR